MGLLRMEWDWGATRVWNEYGACFCVDWLKKMVSVEVVLW